MRVWLSFTAVKEGGGVVIVEVRKIEEAIEEGDGKRRLDSEGKRGATWRTERVFWKVYFVPVRVGVDS